MDSLFSPRLLRPLFWLLLAFALTMALLPKPPSLAIDRFGDKFEHMLAFAALAGVANLGWRHVSPWRIGLRLSAVGALIEVLQMLPAIHRDSDLRDWIADTAAIIVATLIARALNRWIPAPQNR
jgi:VanZ family protein